MLRYLLLSAGQLHGGRVRRLELLVLSKHRLELIFELAHRFLVTSALLRHRAGECLLITLTLFNEGVCHFQLFPVMDFQPREFLAKSTLHNGTGEILPSHHHAAAYEGHGAVVHLSG